MTRPDLPYVYHICFVGVVTRHPVHYMLCGFLCLIHGRVYIRDPPLAASLNLNILKIIRGIKIK
jgi:hypothetical protein